jgi:DNA-binding transcriptional ArsR family regulator
VNLNREQIKCFESPIKATIIAALRSLKRASAKEISQVVGGNANSLYQHLRQLIDVGLVIVAEVRPAETKPETVYELSAPEFFMKGEVGDQEYRESVYRSARNILRLTQRHYERALEQVPSTPELEAAMRFNFVSARLSPARLAKFKQDMEDLLLDAMSSHDPDGESLIYAGLLAPTDYNKNK